MERHVDGLITVGGEYDGSDGTGAISFEVRGAGTHGVDNLRIRARDPLDNILANLNIQANDAPDEQYDLGNGLFVTLGPGSLTDNETASIQVYENVGSAVDPDLPLNGVRNQNPNFQYYPAPDTLAPIVDGTFELNGETINVSAGGTLNDVVNEINLSAAGVTAAFNPVTERIELTQDTEGSVPSIVITGDTSNFIASAKLEGAIVTPGIDPESQQAMTDVGAFSGVSSGSFLINGTSIAVDPGADSLIDVVDGINTSGAGVTASFNETTQRVLIEDNAPASSLDIDSNGTGLFAALNIPEGRVDPVAERSGVSARRSHEIADRVDSILNELNFLFQDSSFQDGASHTGGFRGSLESAVQSLFGEAAARTRSLHGIRFDYRADARTSGDFATFDRQRFVRDIQVRGDAVKNVFAGNGGRVGIIDGLMDAAHQALTAIGGSLGQSGTLVDTYV